MLVTIDAAGDGLLRIVEMKGADVFDADVRIELLDRPFVAVTRSDVITGRKDVARVDTDPDARRVVDAIENFSELLERTAET